MDANERFTRLCEYTAEAANAAEATEDKARDLSTLKAYQRVITVGRDNWVVSSIVAHHTMYMVWYVMEALRSSAGLTSPWNGHDWNFLRQLKADPGHLHPGQGNQSIQVNGKLVQYVTGVVAKDPRETMYMPIWYVMRVLNRAGKSTWNGTTFQMKIDSTKTERSVSTP